MKHASLARFKLSHLWMVLGCLFLAAAQTGADQVAAAPPNTLGSLRQHIYRKQQRQGKQLHAATDSGLAPFNDWKIAQRRW